MTSQSLMIEASSPNARASESVRPFLRWAGGKQKLVTSLVPLSPPEDSYSRYFEPFFGGGSVFFRLLPKNSVIGDINEELCNCYEQVRTNVEDVISKLRRYAKLDSREFYYRIRARSTDAMSAAGRAARFIYINKAAFNGIYRVNSAGKFNVPYGPSQNGPAIPQPDHLRNAAKALRHTRVQSGDFEAILAEAAQGDFIYLDPPYPPRSATAYFTHYSAKRFSWEDQKRVARVYQDLDRRGCFVMLSNAGQKRTIELYQGYNIRRLTATRWLGSNGDRYRVHEIVVTNYTPTQISKGRTDV